MTITNDNTQAKIESLAKALDIATDDAQALIDDGDYVVYTNDEADEAVKNYILESLWAFNYSFLSAHSEAIGKIPEKDFQAIQGKLCESFNDAIAAMLDDSLDDFCADAIACDGRGHFMSSYDGEELKAGEFFAYRIN
jgi:hypothetical protein